MHKTSKNFVSVGGEARPKAHWNLFFFEASTLVMLHGAVIGPTMLYGAEC